MYWCVLCPGDTTDMTNWAGLGVCPKVLQALGDQGFANPTPIQSLSLPPAIHHHQDIIGAAETVSVYVIVV